MTLLLACGLMLSLCACGDDITDTNSNVNSSEAPVSVESVEDSSEDTVQSEQSTEEFEETVLVDDENCTFKITGIDPDNMWGYTLNVYLENKSDKNLMFSINDVSVNGFMCDPFWASSVQTGKKSVEEISFFEEDFETLGIEEVTEIEFTLLVSDEDDWLADSLVEETFTFNP